jgi:hypothetical protein
VKRPQAAKAVGYGVATMANGPSKAQRRAEAQRLKAERLAAEQRAKRRRTTVRWGGAGIIVVGVIVIIVLATGSNGSGPSSASAVKTDPIPSSLHLGGDPATTPGDEGPPIPIGAKLATLSAAATGQTVAGVQCQAGEQLVYHVHTHLSIFVNGKARVIPYGIGIPGFEAVQTPHGPFVETGSCFYWLHTHQEDGVIHVESPSASLHFNLGQFFQEWGIPLSSTQVGPVHGKVTAFFAAPGKTVGIYKGNPANLPLGEHYSITLEVGTQLVKPVVITNWGQL